MPEKAESFYAALKARLAGDAGLSSWATSHFGKELTFIDGHEGGEVRADEHPAIVFDVAESAQADVVLGSNRARVELTILGIIVWLEETASKVLTQRLQLHDILRLALLGDASFGNTALVARMASFDLDNTDEPLAAIAIAVRAEYDLVKA